MRLVTSFRQEEIKIEKLPDAYESTFFPIANLAEGAFVKSYRIRFAMPAAGEFVGAKSGSLTLRIVSPLGRVDLVWLG